MFLPRTICTALFATGLASTAWAQSTSRPLNLKLPPSSTLPAMASSSAAPASAASTAGTDAARPAAQGDPASRTPGMYYGDTSGSTDAGLADAGDVDRCDDATYNDTQVHGSVGMGVMAGSHASGNYQAGTVNLSKAFGDCDHPTGGVSISISGGQGHYDHDRGRFGR